MESNDEQVEKIKVDKIKADFPLDLLKNVRNLIEVINDRIKWKTEELLPIGILIKQIDDLIKEK